MKPQFEEKTYESYFNTELSSKSSFYYPIGQVQEGFLGFDAAANSNNWRLWKRIGFPFWFFPQFKGVNLREIADEMENILGEEIMHVPRMRVNILFQYKRSEFIKSKKGKEWSNWNQAYFRYDIYQEQQDLLMSIHNNFQDEVLLIYAAPLMYKMDELVNAFGSGRIIELSNFRKADELNNHNRNTFIESGTHSIACSKPEKIENFDLINLIESYQSNIKYNGNREFIFRMRKRIEQIMEGNSKYSELFQKLNEPFEKIKKNSLLYSFAVMSNFRLLTGIQWVIKI